MNFYFSSQRIKLILILFLFLLNINFSYAQNLDSSIFNSIRLNSKTLKYYELFNKGRVYQFNRKYDSASLFFYSAFLILPNHGKHIKNFIYNELDNVSYPNSKRLKKYFELYFCKFSDYLISQFLEDKKLREKIPRDVLKYVYRKGQRWRKIFLHEQDLVMARNIKYWSTLDQIARNSVITSFINADLKDQIFKNGSTSVQLFNRTLMDSIDKENRKNILDIISNHGFPIESSKLGSSTYYDFFLLTLHCFDMNTHDSLKYKFIHLMIKSLLEDKLSNDDFAYIIDKDFSFNFTTREINYMYGLLPFVGYTNYNYAVKYIDVGNLDKRRQQIGLMPIFDEARLIKEEKQLPLEYLKLYDINIKR